MTNILFNKQHLKEYLVYGSCAGLLYMFLVWLFLHKPDYYALPVIGSVVFMFVIMAYALKLTRRISENLSVWVMIIAGQMAVAVGIIISMIGSFLLCYLYAPAFLNNGNNNGYPPNAADGHNGNNPDATRLIFICATFGSYAAGAFISALIAYALKPDQTQDATAEIFEEPAEPKLYENYTKERYPGKK